jgi:hypothetical protein
MKTKFGSIIVAGSGKIGGHVASKNRSGSYLRTKVSPTQPRTTYQLAVRQTLSQISSSWKALTTAQILNWNNAVAMYKKTDVFGDVVSPSGFNLFQKLNNNLTRIGKAVLTTPPLPTAVPDVSTGTLTAVHAGALTVTFTTDPIVTASSVEVWATAPQSPGKTFIKSELRYIGILPTITAHASLLTTLYNAKFGTVGSAGQQIFVGLKQVVWASGQNGRMYKCSAIIS